jgi:hypothetical protein
MAIRLPLVTVHDLSQGEPCFWPAKMSGFPAHPDSTCLGFCIGYYTIFNFNLEEWGCRSEYS